MADGTGTWRTPAPDDPEPREFDPNDPAKIVVDLNGADATIKRVLRMDPEDLAALVVLLKDGMVKVWGPDFTSRAERGWLRRKLEIARRVLTLADADNGPG